MSLMVLLCNFLICEDVSMTAQPLGWKKYAYVGIFANLFLILFFDRPGSKCPMMNHFGLAILCAFIRISSSDSVHSFVMSIDLT
jgi:hypothetical protein